MDAQNIKESINFLFFFVDCNIFDTKLNFVPRYSVVCDVSIEIGLHL